MKYKDHVHLATGIALPVIALAKIKDFLCVPLPISFWIILGIQGMVDLDLLFVKNGKGHRTNSIAHRGDVSFVFLLISLFLLTLSSTNKSIAAHPGKIVLDVVSLCIFGWNLHLFGDLLQGGVGVRRNGKIVRAGATSFTWDKYNSPGRGFITTLLLLFVLGSGAWTFSHLMIAFLPESAYRNIISCFLVYAFSVARNSSVKMAKMWTLLSIVAVVFYFFDTPFIRDLIPEGKTLQKIIAPIKNFVEGKLS